jgi:hypothetical protein
LPLIDPPKFLTRRGFVFFSTAMSEIAFPKLNATQNIRGFVKLWTSKVSSLSESVTKRLLKRF